jgi:hypothetical protein
MFCAVYKGNKKPDTYLYLDREDDFSRVPEALLALLGSLELVLTFDLVPDRRLPMADAAEVVSSLASRGYYLQFPPGADDGPGDGR